MSDPIRDPRTPSSALELDERELNELDPTQRNALARHPNTPISTLERLARHHPETLCWKTPTRRLCSAPSGRSAS